jgi:hypothetical protein
MVWTVATSARSTAPLVAAAIESGSAIAPDESELSARMCAIFAGDSLATRRTAHVAVCRQRSFGSAIRYTGSTSDRRHYTRDATMKNGARVILMVLGALVSDFHHPASAQSSVGGPKKQISVGGAAKQSSPVVPTNKGGSISISQPSHPISAPAQPISAKPSHLISAPAQPKCPAGPCVAKKSSH